MPETYTGGCHCGAVRFTATADIGQVIECNCSHCSAKGLLLAFIPAGQFDLEKGEGALSDYRFNTHKIDHQFCTTCGIESFARGVGPDGAAMVVINVNCLEPAVPVDRGAIQHYDGANW